MVENMFFLINKSVIEEDQPIIVMESYERTDATEDVLDTDGNVIDTIVTASTTCMRLKSSTPNIVTRMAYVIGGIELRDLSKVGTHEGKDVVHAVSSIMELKEDDSYLGDAYSKLKNVPGIGASLHDAVHDTIYEVDEEVDGEMQKVRKRKKTKVWKGKGSPPIKIAESIPHVFLGVAVE